MLIIGDWLNKLWKFTLWIQYNYGKDGYEEFFMSLGFVYDTVLRGKKQANKL